MSADPKLDATLARWNALPIKERLAIKHNLPDHPLPPDSRFKLEERQLHAWDCLTQQERGDALRRIDAVMLELSRIGKPIEVAVADLGYVISDGTDSKWRYWRIDPEDKAWCGPDWTDDIKKACHFARRQDAETWAHDDEDACFIRPVKMGTQSSGPVAAPEKPVDDGGREKAAKELVIRIDRILRAPADVWTVDDTLPVLVECGGFLHYYCPEAKIISGQLAPTKEDEEQPDPDRPGFMLPVDKLSPAEVLLLFRAFVIRNVTQWALGAGDHHHPIWEHVAVNVADAGVEPTSGPRWAYIQPLNRKRLGVLEVEFENMRDAHEAEARGG